MSIFAILYTPLVLLIPVAGSVDAGAELAGASRVAPAEQAPVHEEPPEEGLVAERAEVSPVGSSQAGSFRKFVRSFRDAGAKQARIEQRMTIRITPSPSRMQMSMQMEPPRTEIEPQLEERRMGKCVPVSSIAGVQPDSGQRLILFMRDRRIVRARLERSCQARDFYSGFYLSRSSDGKLCIDRDTLQSRSGANCKVTRFRELIEVGN